MHLFRTTIDRFVAEGKSKKDYLKHSALRIEALNHALRDVPRGSGPVSHLLGQLARSALD